MIHIFSSSNRPLKKGEVVTSFRLTSLWLLHTLFHQFAICSFYITLVLLVRTRILWTCIVFNIKLIEDTVQHPESKWKNFSFAKNNLSSSYYDTFFKKFFFGSMTLQKMFPTTTRLSLIIFFSNNMFLFLISHKIIPSRY